MGGNADDKKRQDNEDEDYQNKRREALKVIEKLRALGIECELSEDLSVVRKDHPH